MDDVNSVSAIVSDNSVSAIMNDQVIWGVLIGVALTHISQWILSRQHQKTEQKITSMQIATLVRSWLTDCAAAVLDHENWESSDGNMGRRISNVPTLSLEQSLDQIVRLKPSYAKAVFEFIQEAKDAERSAAFMVDAVGGEEATDLLHESCGALFITALDIHKKLAKSVKWEEAPFAARTIEKMTILAERSNRDGDEP